MNGKKMRIIPPIIVSLVVVLALTVVAIITINNNVILKAEASEKQAQEEPNITRTVVVHNTTEISPTTTEEPEPTHESMIMSRDWDAEESLMLMKIAMAEAEGESVEGKALVMLVVLNRVWSDEFPGTIEEVIFQPKQFSPVTEGGRYYTTEPDEECYEALELVMSGWDESDGALYFESCENSSWHSENLDFLYQVGNHKFYR